ncbi:unnamed protein product [Tilletia caries]|nr:unnamed protein product [Tilletia caries]
MMRLLANMDGLPRFDSAKEMSCRVRCTAHVLNLVSKAVLKSFYPRRSKRGGDGAAEEDGTANVSWDVEVEQDYDDGDDEGDGEELDPGAEGDEDVPKDKRLKRSDEADVRKLVDLLNPLAQATLKFSAKTTPTIGDVIGLFEDVDEHFASVQASEDEEYVWKQAATRGHLVIAKYYGFTEQADVYSMAILLHPNYRAAYMDVLKWPKDWQKQAEKVLRDTFVKHCEIRGEEADIAEGSQIKDFDKLDKTTQALMRLAKERQKNAPARDAIAEWLAGLTMLHVGEEGTVVRIDPLQWWWSERKKGNEHDGLTAMALDVFSTPVPETLLPDALSSEAAARKEKRERIRNGKRKAKEAEGNNEATKRTKRVDSVGDADGEHRR